MLDRKKTYDDTPQLILIENLRRLMAKMDITEAELSRRTNIPQTTLHKILTGKTEDPRGSTLISLASFFNISLDELLTGAIQAHAQPALVIQSIPIISWTECLQGIQFLERLTPENWHNWVACDFVSKHAYALISRTSMESLFPKGSMLIIDPDLIPTDGDIVVVHYPDAEEATLRELSIDGPVKLLLPLSSKLAQTTLDKNTMILGVLTKSMFSYHG